MKRIVLVFVLVAAMVAMALPAVATPPSAVHIEVETSFQDAPSSFVASGPAVDDGIMCETGLVVDDSAKATGFSQNGFNFQGVKRFTCDDGSGEFFINLQARIDFRKGVTFQWNVLRGTGDYEDLHGAGSGDGLPECGDDCVLDVYAGGMHID